MQKSSLQPKLTTVSVCHDCMAALTAQHGACLDTTVKSFALGETCSAHPSLLPIQAQHSILVDASAIERFRGNAWIRSTGGRPARDDREVALVATVAAQLLTGNPGAPDGDILAAVETARRIFKAAKE